MSPSNVFSFYYFFLYFFNNLNYSVRDTVAYLSWLAKLRGKLERWRIPWTNKNQETKLPEYKFTMHGLKINFEKRSIALSMKLVFNLYCGITHWSSNLKVLTLNFKIKRSRLTTHKYFYQEKMYSKFLSQISVYFETFALF